MDPDFTDPAAVAVLLERHHGVHARNAADLIRHLAARYQLAVACWTAADLAAICAGYTDGDSWELTDSEIDRAYATRAWRQLAHTVAANGAMQLALREVLTEAGLVCTQCRTPIHGDIAETLAHCDTCRDDLGAEAIARNGCPAKGYRRHHTDKLATHGPGPTSRRGFCWDCGTRLTGVPVCEGCRADDASNTPQISRTCDCRVWQPLDLLTTT